MKESFPKPNEAQKINLEADLRRRIFAAMLTLAPQFFPNAEAADIPSKTPWIEGVQKMLSQQDVKGVEMLAYMVLNDSTTKWISSPDTAAKKTSARTTDQEMENISVIFEREKLPNIKPVICFLHTHPNTPDDPKGYPFNPYMAPSILPDEHRDDLSYSLARKSEAPEYRLSGELRFAAISNEAIWYWRPMNDDENEKYSEQTSHKEMEKFISQNQTLVSSVESLIRIGFKYRDDGISLSAEDIIREVLMSRLNRNKNENPTNGEKERNDNFLKEKRTNLPVEIFNRIIRTFNEHISVTRNRGYQAALNLEKNEKIDEAMETMEEFCRANGADCRFVPTKFISEEPACAGTDYPVRYKWDAEKKEWRGINIENKVEIRATN